MTRLLPAATTAAVRTGGVACPHGWITARVPIESVGQALGDFLRLGADIEVLDPADLRDQIARAARDLAALYDGQHAAAASPLARAPRDECHAVTAADSQA